MLRGFAALTKRPDFHEPAVDGIRAIGVLWVFILHVVFFHFGTFPDEVQAVFKGTWTKWIGQGHFGVDLFFVISGYLIGTILLKELRKTDEINLKRFYGRRFLRLIPVYVVVMLMGAYFLRNIPKSAILMDIAPSGNVEYAWTNLLYVNNFVTVGKQYMPWCWSLAIEEQFYLIVPFFLLVLVDRSKRSLLWMLLLLVLSGVVRLAIIRAYDFVPPFRDLPDAPAWSLRFDVIYDKLHVRYGGLLAGVVGAYLSSAHRERLEAALANRLYANGLLAVSLVTFGVISSLSLGSDWVETAPKWLAQLIYSHRRDALSIAVLLVILVAIHGRGTLAAAVKAVLSARILYPIAQLSYSVYLLHEMFMLWAFPKTTPWLQEALGLGPMGVLWVNGVGVTIVTFGVATILYVAVERPCMEYRKSALFRRLVESGASRDAESAQTEVKSA